MNTLEHFSANKFFSLLLSRLEHSAANIADSIQHGGLPTGSVAPSLIEVCAGLVFWLISVAMISYFSFLFGRLEKLLQQRECKCLNMWERRLWIY